jgi:iron complex transport system ATP-binding protein
MRPPLSETPDPVRGPAAPGHAPAPILAAADLSFRHAGAAGALFERFSVDLAAGDFVAVLGPNGSGKTTLLRLLSGTLSPGGGEVLLSGHPVRDLLPRQRARVLAVVLQESRILFNFSVLEVVLMGRAPHLGLWGLEGPADFDAARAALREVDLEGCENRNLDDLSSGERQRALIARALAQQPRILLLDEPTAFLDMKHALEIYEILRRLNRERGLTVVAASHDLNLAARYASRVALLHRGRVAADGTPVAVLTPETICRVYETNAEVFIDPATGAPYLIPRAPLGGG